MNWLTSKDLPEKSDASVALVCPISAYHVGQSDAAEHDKRDHHRQVRDPEKSIDHLPLQLPHDAKRRCLLSGYAGDRMIIHSRAIKGTTSHQGRIVGSKMSSASWLAQPIVQQPQRVECFGLASIHVDARLVCFLRWYFLIRLQPKGRSPCRHFSLDGLVIPTGPSRKGSTAHPATQSRPTWFASPTSWTKGRACKVEHRASGICLLLHGLDELRDASLGNASSVRNRTASTSRRRTFSQRRRSPSPPLPAPPAAIRVVRLPSDRPPARRGAEISVALSTSRRTTASSAAGIFSRSRTARSGCRPPWQRWRA